jgi:phospholipase D1/2
MIQAVIKSLLAGKDAPRDGKVTPANGYRIADLDVTFSEQQNCWRVERAQRVACLIDGEQYFAALRGAMLQARQSIFMVGWDLHSELQLVRDDTDDGYPHTLRELLDTLAGETPGLNIYILNWDFAMVYAMEREFFPSYKLQWRSHERVHFCLDGEHPVGGSQHQKLVVIDDRVAFSGGMDLSKWRWDSREHRPQDPRRVDPDGDPYPPFHDVQMAVDGAAAAALGELARQRWTHACDESLEAASADSDPWPPAVRPDFEDVDIAIARTLPEHRQRPQIREIEQLYLDSIAAARRFIYIENQYLSSHRIGDALAERLREQGGPEIVVVMPRETGGWLEQHTMDVLRARLMQRLREADTEGRLRVFYPRVSASPEVSVMVHAKVMIVDDELLRIASSNLSNRSMGLDSECDLALCCEAGSARQRTITAVRHSLLAEHLGIPASEFAAAEADSGSLVEAVERLRGGVRTLVPLATEVSPEVDALVPDSAVIDPEKPVEPQELLDYVLGASRQTRRASRYGARLALLLAALLGVAALWRFTPLADWLDIDRLEAMARWVEQSPLTPLLVVGAYVAGGLLVVPVSLLIIATISVFGPWWGALYSLVGSEIAAVVTFLVGHMLGRRTVARLAGSQANRLSRALARGGVITIITLRIVPVAPFSIINVIAGVSGIRLRDFAIGNLLGMLPGIAAFAFFADRLVASLRAPDLPGFTVLLASVIAISLGLWGLRRWLRRRGSASDAGA